MRPSSATLRKRWQLDLGNLKLMHELRSDEALAAREVKRVSWRA